MTGDEALGWLISAILAVFALVMLLRGTIVFTGGNLARLGWVLAAAAALLVVLYVRRRLQVSQRVEGAMTANVDAHGETGPASYLQRLIGRHEIGHVVGAEDQGMGVAEVEIGPGWGRVRAKRFVSIDASITFLASGHKAVHTKRGAGGDLDAIAELAAEIPRPERRRRVDAAVRRAGTVTSREQPRIRRDGHRLADTGKW